MSCAFCVHVSIYLFIYFCIGDVIAFRVSAAVCSFCSSAICLLNGGRWIGKHLVDGSTSIYVQANVVDEFSLFVLKKQTKKI